MSSYQGPPNLISSDLQGLDQKPNGRNGAMTKNTSDEVLAKMLTDG